MIYALINKPYILDLYPGNSLIEHLTNQGHDVYLLDWGTAGREKLVEEGGRMFPIRVE